MASDQRPSNVGAYLALVIIPLLVTSALLLVGWVFARCGASYKTTRLVLYPAALFIANFFAAMPFVCFGWLIALLIGSSDMANYVMGSVSELSLLSSLFGDPITVPKWHIALYQLVVWLLLTRQVAEVVTTAIYNSANE